MLYSEIAAVLQEISLAVRARKATLAGELIAGLSPDMLTPVVRLLTGDLWPSWEEREMGIGPQSILAALSGVSDVDVPLLKGLHKELGLVAQAALQRKSWRPLSQEPLQARSVYETLLRISEARGVEAMHRKDSLLRGLFLEATPLEGKFIARTALRCMRTGIGPQTMLGALSLAFHCRPSDLQRAYRLMPDAGLVACAARAGELDRVAIKPGRPVRPMIIRPGAAMLPGAFLPRYDGLRIQVHSSLGMISVFTSSLRNITSTLGAAALGSPRASQKSDWIVEAVLIGFQNGRICSTAEMMRYINRQRLSRKSSVSPSVLAYDIICHDGEDLTGHPYQERRRRLLAALSKPKELPFQGISSAEEQILSDAKLVEDLLHKVRKAGGSGLISRDLRSPYYPGSFAKVDSLVGSEETISAAVVSAKYGRGRHDKLLVRYEVALRRDEDLVPVGFVSRGLHRKELQTLSDHLVGLAWEEDESGIKVRPSVVLTLRISDVRLKAEGYVLLGSRVGGMLFDAALEDVDSMNRLDMIAGYDLKTL